MIKRIFISFLVFSLLICPFEVFASEHSETNETVLMQENFEVSEAMNLVSALDIMSVPEDMSAFVTRQQFVDFAAKMLKLNTVAGEKIFADTDAESTAHIFAKMNFLKVGEDKRFRPADIITYEEACIVLVRVLGYEEYVHRLGGNVSEYMRCAKRLGIELDRAVTDKLVFSDVVNLLADALNAQIYETVAIGKGAEYAQTDTLLKRIYGVYSIKGFFNANEWTSAYKDVPSPGEGRIVINKVTLDAKDSIYAESMLLGRRVKAYVKKTEKDILPKVILVIPDEENMEIFSFSSKEFIGTDGNTISFVVNDKERTVSLNYPTLIYNGEADFSAGLNQIINLLDNYNTQVTIVKDKTEGSNATVIVNEYTNAEVTSVDYVAGVIYAKDSLDNSYKIPTSKMEKAIIRNMETDEKEALTDIERGSIISFCISKSQNIVTVYHCTKTVQGTIESLSGSRNDIFATIEGKKYAVNEKLLGKQLAPGVLATFYLGINNEIIAAKDVQDTWQTGYLYHIGDMNEAFSDTNYKFKVFTTDGTVKVFTCANRFTLDGVPKSSDSAFYDRIAPGGTVNDELRLFRYKINANGELKNIDTAALLDETPEEGKSLRILGKKHSRTFRQDTNSGYMLFEADVTTSGTTITPAAGENRIYSYPVNKITEVFSVPHTADFEALDRNFNYSTVEKYTNFTKDKKETCAFYNVDANSEYVSMIINYRNPVMNYTEKSNPYLINDVGIEVINEDGDVCKGIEVITTLAVSTGKLTDTVLLDSTVTFTDVKGNKTVKTDTEVIASLSPGDVIQYGSSTSKRTGSIRVLYDYDADDPNTTADDNRGQVYWGWTDEAGNTLSVYNYRYTSATSVTNLSVDFSGVYGYLLDSVVDADTQAQDDAYGRTAPSCYVFLGSVGTEGSNTIHGSAGWATGYRRLTMFDNSRRQSKAYWGIFTDLVNYKSSQDDYYYVLLFNGSTNQQGNCAVFYKR